MRVFTKWYLLAAALVSLLPVCANAATERTYAPYWAWDNNFNNAAIQWYPGTGSNPRWAASFDFRTFNLYGYPASVRGWHYGYNPSADRLFPKQLSATTSIPVAFSYASGGANMAGDFAYDMFLRNDNVPAAPQLEVMVWAGNNSYPLGAPIQKSAVSEAGISYDLWGGYNTGAGYYVYTFIPHRSAVLPSLPTRGSANLDLKPLFNVLRNRAYYSPKMYLDVIEAGCEITRGRGWVATTYFQANAYPELAGQVR